MAQRWQAWRSHGRLRGCVGAGFNMMPEMLVVYTAGQQWERQFVPEGSETAPDETPPRRLVYPQRPVCLPMVTR